MRLIAIICVTLAILLNGCAKKAPIDQIVYVPQKCHVEIVRDPTIEECDIKNVLECGKCAYRNYLNDREARELQITNAKVCK